MKYVSIDVTITVDFHPNINIFNLCNWEIIGNNFIDQRT